ncbi:DUF402 domain-containing protein [Paenibacillus sp. MBLB4367]|uniref:DUF402 domain-containing protein n=1 Tax=Paenibacillus sp. MBLB4367 TaxID=3384767 RepID=UPI0039083E5F
MNYTIKSFKHDGRLHRVWLQNWRVPANALHPDHAAEGMLVFVNSHTRIREADGTEWTSKVPGVSFFIPGQWFNIVALLEHNGIRYYCNVASPPYEAGQVVTYIDYDLDVIRMMNGETVLVDEDEYERHKAVYHYSPMIEEKVQAGLSGLLGRLERRAEPFNDKRVYAYYDMWRNRGKEGERD